MFISASRRTDIPAFYGKWFINRLREGLVVTYNSRADKYFKYRLTPDTVDGIVFWTKNAIPFTQYLDEVYATGIPFYFQYTCNPYDKSVERHVPDKIKIIENMKHISATYGKDRVIWRYDPIMFSPTFTVDWHCEQFAQMCALLSGHVNKCVFSFLDIDYKACKQNNLNATDGTANMRDELAMCFSEIADRHGIKLATCAEGIDLEQYGIEHNACIDADLFEVIANKDFPSKAHKKDPAQRSLCGCVVSTDIGVYNTCLHDCAYCYANFKRNEIKSNCAKHDDTSPTLIGQCDANTLPFVKSFTSFLA